MKFNIGDTVRLKSGGPLMTIESEINGRFWCSWFDEKKQFKKETFPPETLEADDGAPPRVR